MKSKVWTSGVAVGLLMTWGAASAQQPVPPTSPPPMPSAPAPGTAPRAAPGAVGTLSAAEREFIQTALRNNEREVAVSDLAKEKAQTTAVAQFAARMVHDHGVAARELRQLAANKGIGAAGAAAGPEHPPMQWLTKLSSPQFEQQYVAEMMRQHQHDIGELRRMQQQTQDPELRAWIDKTLPVIEQHMMQVKALSAGSVTGQVR